MVFLRLAWGRLHASILALVGTTLIALPAFAQPDTSLTSTSTTTTSTSTEFISDWRLWAVVGAVLLVILVIALTRGKSDTTTIVK